MAIFGSDILCPYCLEKLRGKDVKTLCQICGSEIVPTKTDLLLKRIPKCTADRCRGQGTIKICGVCERELPADIMDYAKYLRFSLLGVSGAGKTTYLTAMLHELRRDTNCPWVLSPMDHDTTVTYQTNEQKLFKDRARVDPTPMGMAPDPQLWRIRDKSRMSGNRIPSYSLTIFDGAGEDHTNIDPVISRYISGSKTLVILIDPLSLPGVARSISQNVVNWSCTTQYGEGASADMVDGIANYIRQSSGLRANELIKKDVAVVFTKIDAVKSHFASSVVMQPSVHVANKAFVKTDADAVDMEIRDWLVRNGEVDFLNAIETNFRSKQVRFFGVSSLGQPPTSAHGFGVLTPHRVLDPLFWMLAEEGIIPTI